MPYCDSPAFLWEYVEIRGEDSYNGTVLARGWQTLANAKEVRFGIATDYVLVVAGWD